MASLPPELAQARTLLRQLVPENGSKKRVYARVMAHPSRRDKLGARLAIVTACLCLSASAMGLGYRLVTRNQALQLPDSTNVHVPQTAGRVPRKQQMNASNPGETAAAVSATSRAAACDETAAARLEKPPVSGAEGKALGDLPRRLNGSLQVAAIASSQPEPTVGGSELSQQVADYRIAVAELRGNPALALQRLKEHRANWPSSAIRHEVDLRIIEALVTLGRHSEARDAARSFLQRYPDSARAVEVRRIAESEAIIGTPDN